jgi:hypothetical protein
VQSFPELTEEERLYGLFQQDSTTGHTARMSMQALSVVFWDRIISRLFGQHVHPILIFVIFFFCGDLKDKDYNSNPRKEEN